MLSSILVNVETQYLVLAAGLLIPLLHGILVKSTANDQTKVALTLVLTGFAGLLATMIAEEGNLSDDLLLTWGTTFVVTIASHYGIYKPLTVTGSGGKLQQVTQGKGLSFGTEEPEWA